MIIKKYKNILNIYLISTILYKNKKGMRRMLGFFKEFACEKFDEMDSFLYFYCC